MTATDWYAPNQQAVRADASGPAEQGTGGSTPDEQGPVDRSERAAEPEAEPEPAEAE